MCLLSLSRLNARHFAPKDVAPEDYVARVVKFLKGTAIGSLIAVPCTSVVAPARSCLLVEARAREYVVKLHDTLTGESHTSSDAFDSDKETLVTGVPSTVVALPEEVYLANSDPAWSPTAPRGKTTAVSSEFVSLGDRVVTLRSDSGVPLRSHGTVVGIHSQFVEVIFDNAFAAGTQLNGKCLTSRGKMVPLNSLLNLSDPRPVLVHEGDKAAASRQQAEDAARAAAGQAPLAAAEQRKGSQKGPKQTPQVQKAQPVAGANDLVAAALAAMEAEGAGKGGAKGGKASAKAKGQQDKAKDAAPAAAAKDNKAKDAAAPAAAKGNDNAKGQKDNAPVSAAAPKGKATAKPAAVAPAAAAAAKPASKPAAAAKPAPAAAAAAAAKPVTAVDEHEVPLSALGFAAPVTAAAAAAAMTSPGHSVVSNLRQMLAAADAAGGSPAAPAAAGGLAGAAGAMATPVPGVSGIPVGGAYAALSSGYTGYSVSTASNVLYSSHASANANNNSAVPAAAAAAGAVPAGYVYPAQYGQYAAPHYAAPPMGLGMGMGMLPMGGHMGSPMGPMGGPMMGMGMGSPYANNNNNGAPNAQYPQQRGPNGQPR